MQWNDNSTYPSSPPLHYPAAMQPVEPEPQPEAPAARRRWNRKAKIAAWIALAGIVAGAIAIHAARQHASVDYNDGLTLAVSVKSELQRRADDPTDSQYVAGLVVEGVSCTPMLPPRFFCTASELLDGQTVVANAIATVSADGQSYSYIMRPGP